MAFSIIHLWAALMTVAAAFAVLRVRADTDPVTDYTMIANSAGEPEGALCIGKTSKCYKQTLQCPKLCPKRSAESLGESACFIDCFHCQCTCRHRHINCYGYGAVCYDPRFVGGDGVMFYFHGKQDQDFCLVSDRNLHINAHFIGKRPEGRTRDYTWVQSLGIMFNSHKLSVGARKVAMWDDEVDQLVFSYDDVEFTIPNHEAALWSSSAGDVLVERTAVTNAVYVVVHEVLEVKLSVVPITEKESKVHNYQIGADDCFAHLQMQFGFFGLSSSVNGVLGQTYQPGFKTPVKVGVPMPIMGGDEKYLSSSLMSADCKVSQFSLNLSNPEVLDVSPLERLQIHCSSSQRGGMTCRR